MRRFYLCRRSLSRQLLRRATLLVGPQTPNCRRRYRICLSSPLLSSPRYILSIVTNHVLHWSFGDDCLSWSQPRRNQAPCSPHVPPLITSTPSHHVPSNFESQPAPGEVIAKMSCHAVSSPPQCGEHCPEAASLDNSASEVCNGC